MRKRPPRTLKKTYIVYVEGETEVTYLSFFNSREAPFKIKPELPRDYGIKKQFREIKKLIKTLEENDKIYWILDGDQLFHNNGINELKDVLNEIRSNLKLKEKIIVLINNPCLEFWFLLHFRLTTKRYIRCDQVIQDLRTASKIINEAKLKELIRTYNKNTGHIEKLSPHLKNLTEKAIKNAKKVGKFNIHQRNSCAEIYILLENVLGNN